MNYRGFGDDTAIGPDVSLPLKGSDPVPDWLRGLHIYSRNPDTSTLEEPQVRTLPGPVMLPLETASVAPTAPVATVETSSNWLYLGLGAAGVWLLVSMFGGDR